LIEDFTLSPLGRRNKTKKIFVELCLVYHDYDASQNA
jgi:hypothetical protein